MLWRGRDQASLSFQNSIDMFLETKFRDISNTHNKKHMKKLRSASTFENVSNLMKNDELKSLMIEKGADTR